MEKQRCIIQKPMMIMAFFMAVFTIYGCTSTTEQELVPEDPLPLFSSPLSLDTLGRPIISVMINEQGPYPFVFDTAATKTGVLKTILDDIGWDGDTSKRVRIVGLNGAVRAPLTSVSSLTLQGSNETFTNLPIVVLDAWQEAAKQPAGVIGLDIIKRYGIVMNAEEKRIDFYAPGAMPEIKLSTWASTPFRDDVAPALASQLIMVNAKMDLTGFPALIDTGADATIGNTALLERLNTIPTLEELRKGKNVQGFTGGETPTYEVSVYRIRLGNIRWRDTKMLIADTFIFEELGSENLPIGIIGFSYFHYRPLAIDFVKRRFYVGDIATK